MSDLARLSPDTIRRIFAGAAVMFDSPPCQLSARPRGATCDPAERCERGKSKGGTS